MVLNLDDQKIYKKLDADMMYKSIEMLWAQMKQVLDEAHLVKVPREYSKVTQVVINGMGGSNIGIGLVRAGLNDRIKLPITITPGYQVPALVDKNTLYLLSSYSGNTEEPLSVYNEVKKRGAKILAICELGDNKLARLMMKDNIPGYMFKPEFNPSGQPRMGLGYSVLGAAMLLAKAGLFSIKESELKNVIAKLELSDQIFRPGEPVKINKAKQAAMKLYGRVPIITAAEFLAGNLNILRNQFNETSKNFATFLELPDLNHYALEGLINPKNNKDNLVFLFIDSSFYHARVQKRADLTKQIIKKNKIKYVEHQLSGKTKFEQALEMMQFGTWVSYYLAMLNNVNPAKIPWVDWLKKELE
ncbi:SIS domain-containing protein [Patescibacteria group bacterium]|nr:SIS domain-containing protein [Patescibacteria group bacterium]MBU1663025.1 SIS domain-containing protein [Patescibacteria group bacterium]MBU1934166.1 SIS domain-containing protein [Patescibacteria group bacterium]MBU2007549.1 SIS domain-containing protein [Patescibacteria group bacterium]MBU2233499.1 SIS domain-containing protein [Patescibacteria group bacterium]